MCYHALCITSPHLFILIEAVYKYNKKKKFSVGHRSQRGPIFIFNMLYGFAQVGLRVKHLADPHHVKVTNLCEAESRPRDWGSKMRVLSHTL